MAKKYKTPAYIKPCGQCGQGKGYHPLRSDNAPTIHLCDTCFRAMCDAQLRAMIERTATA